MATSEVVCCIFLSTDELLRMEQLAVCASSDFINDSGLKIYENCTRHVLSCTGLAEEGVESIVTSTNGLITWHLPISLKKQHSNAQHPLQPKKLFKFPTSTLNKCNIGYKECT